jgi:hypothetical protein
VEDIDQEVPAMTTTTPGTGTVLPMTMIGHLLGVPPGNMSAVRSWSRTFMAGSLAYPDARAAAATNLLG